MKKQVILLFFLFSLFIGFGCVGCGPIGGEGIGPIAPAPQDSTGQDEPPVNDPNDPIIWEQVYTDLGHDGGLISDIVNFNGVSAVCGSLGDIGNQRLMLGTIVEPGDFLNFQTYGLPGVYKQLENLAVVNDIIHAVGWEKFSTNSSIKQDGIAVVANAVSLAPQYFPSWFNGLYAQHLHDVVPNVSGDGSVAVGTRYWNDIEMSGYIVTISSQGIIVEYEFNAIPGSLSLGSISITGDNYLIAGTNNTNSKVILFQLDREFNLVSLVREVEVASNRYAEVWGAVNTPGGIVVTGYTRSPGTTFAERISRSDTDAFAILILDNGNIEVTDGGLSSYKDYFFGVSPGGYCLGALSDGKDLLSMVGWWQGREFKYRLLKENVSLWGGVEVNGSLMVVGDHVVPSEPPQPYAAKIDLEKLRN